MVKQERVGRHLRREKRCKMDSRRLARTRWNAVSSVGSEFEFICIGMESFHFLKKSENEIRWKPNERVGRHLKRFPQQIESKVANTLRCSRFASIGGPRRTRDVGFRVSNTRRKQLVSRWLARHLLLPGGLRPFEDERSLASTRTQKTSDRTSTELSNDVQHHRIKALINQIT